MGKVTASGSTKTATSQTSSSLLTDSQLVRYLCVSVLSALLSDKQETKNVLTTAPGKNNYYLLLLVFSPWASFGRNQNPVRRQVWLWYVGFWASS
jgi:hypothetical protein